MFIRTKGEYKMKSKGSLTAHQKQIIKQYKDLVKELNNEPSKADLITSGVSKERIRHHFGSMTGLKNAVKEHYPNITKLLEKKPHVLADFTRNSLGSIVKNNNHKNGTYFITAASPTSYLDWSEDDFARAKQGEDVQAENLFNPGFNATQTFLKKNKAELIILPMRAHVKALQKQPQHYDPNLKPYLKNFATEYTFNKHLKAIDAYLNPQQINPLTGLKRLRVYKYNQNDKPGTEILPFKTSLIIAHSKQMLEVVPTGNNTTPRLIHSTGCITNPGYLRNRIGMIADEDHKLGGLIIEIKDDTFWVRQVQFDRNDGSFVDLGKRYHANGTVTQERAEAFKIGDLHAGHHDGEALDGMFKLWDLIQPKRIFFEDFFDGSSISHHIERNKLTKAKTPSKFKDLPTEINMCKFVIDTILKKAPKDAKFYATASNHHDFLMRYLNEGRYLNDISENYKIAHKMVVMNLEGKDPLQEYVDPDKKMVWTHENDDIHVEGVQMNVHGHLGINGAKGSKIGHELAHGNAMVAHSHSPSIYHDTFTVGHMSDARHGYNNGPSTWLLCCGAVYKGGAKQLYIIINGEPFHPKKK